MLASKFMLPTIGCNSCGFKGGLRRILEAESETIVGKTWGARLVKIKCIKCLQVFNFEDYPQTKESVADFRKLFYI